MLLAPLARHLRATTMFSPLPLDRLLGLLERSAHRQARVGEWLDDSPQGIRNHLVLLEGVVETRRRWIAPDGTEGSLARCVGIDAGGPGFALISAASSQLHVLAKTDVAYLSIDSDEVDELLGWGSLGAFVLPESHLKVFHQLPLEHVAKAINCLIERPVAAGETVVGQGEPGDDYYVILEGEAEVWQTDALTGQARLVNRLVDGDSFGEEALLAESARTASVTMTTPGRLLRLGKADFNALLEPPMVEMVDAQSAREMLRLGVARLLDCRHPAEQAQERIPGATLLPLDEMRHEGVFALDSDQTYIVYCRNGRRSRAAAFLLRERGIRALALTGGLAAWPYALEEGH
ncbi:MAG: cyclic nucleotide-binding domain-containing protein [Rubrivivax sp.]|nr:cyclic nucleotide-binding domain-containing protein [Rubrivivax sp.]